MSKIIIDVLFVQTLGISISWPTASASIGTGGHAITGWGDDGTSANLSNNTRKTKVSDSDNDSGGDVQTYSYDGYSNPNPSGPNEGNGWYFNYSSNHPYIKHIITLCPTTSPAGTTHTQKVVGSFRIHQGNKDSAATGMLFNTTMSISRIQCPLNQFFQKS